MICQNCKDECKPVEVSFDYPAAHCNSGLGIHYTGEYTSDCCDAEIDLDGEE